MVRSGRFMVSGLRYGKVFVGIPARARTRPGPGRHLPRRRPGAHAQLPGVLFLAAPQFRGGRGGARGQARQPRMAARQKRGAGRGLLARRHPRPLAAPVPLYRQRPRRGQPGQAPHPGGHHRPPDAGPDPRRDLRPAAKAGAADGRVLRGPVAGPAPRAAFARGHPGARAQRRPARRAGFCQTRRRGRARRLAAAAGCLPVRDQGITDPRRPAHPGQLAAGPPADRHFGGAGALPRWRGRRQRSLLVAWRRI
jgi:hypothetical protein